MISKEELDVYFDELTLNVSKNRLLIKLNDDGKFDHYVLRLEVDTDPDKCEGDNDECGIGDFTCWMCDRVSPWVTMWADPIDDPEQSECINDEFCGWVDDTVGIYEQAEKEYGDDVQIHGIRHGESDWSLGIDLAHSGLLVNRLGYVFSIPRPTEKLELKVNDHDEGIQEPSDEEFKEYSEDADVFEKVDHEQGTQSLDVFKEHGL